MKVSKKENSAILFLYEGDTERDFYNTLFEKIGLGSHAIIKKSNLRGNTGLNARVTKKIDAFLENKANAGVAYLTVFVAYDREDFRENAASRIDKTLIANTVNNKRLKAINEIIATQMLESWFFIDISGIYSYLGIAANKQTLPKYRDHERYTASDLHDLFKHEGKRYIKGAGCIDLINHLDLIKIHDNCEDLKNGISKVFQVAGIKRL